MLSKIIIKGKTYGKFFIGSMNLTQNGFYENEECLLCGEYDLGERSSKEQRLAIKIEEYAEEIKEKSEILKGGTKKQAKSNSLRALLLDGHLYHEFKEQRQLGFTVSLPEEARQISGQLPSLNAKYVDTLSIENLIEYSIKHSLIKRNPDINNPVELENDSDAGREKSQWRSYCLETCYRYWAPTELEEKISEEQEKIAEKRRPYYTFIRDTLKNYKKELVKGFSMWRKELNSELEDMNISNWVYGDEKRAEKRWKDHYIRICKQLNDNDTFE